MSAETNESSTAVAQTTARPLTRRAGLDSGRHRISAAGVLHRLQRAGYRVLGCEPAEVRIERFRRSAHRELWDSFIARSANGNLFQTRRFLEYHPAGRFEDHSLLFWRGNELLGVAAGEIAGTEWSSHRFTSHAGIAVAPDLSGDEALTLVDALLSYAARHRWKKIFMRYLPDAIAENGFAPILWALSVFGFVEDSRELTWCLIPRFGCEGDLLASYHPSARRGIKRAQGEGLCVRASDDFGSFWKLLDGNLQQKFRVSPTHSLAEIESLQARCSGEVRLHAVHTAQGRMVAGTVIFDVSRTASHCFYFAQDYAFQRARPMMLLLHAINVEYALRLRRRLNYGVITACGARELNLGLSRFKSRFAATPSIRRRFYWEAIN
ncbi:MAG TPA: GNAT family N-acetyltransferase [Candidatus Binatia bacterium]